MARKRQFKGAAQRLRARFHDFNSQRRYRGQPTISWEAYKRRTRGGRIKLRRTQ